MQQRHANAVPVAVAPALQMLLMMRRHDGIALCGNAVAVGIPRRRT
jgi:hypothetical protein